MKQITVTVHQDLRQLAQPNPWLSLLQIRFPDGTARNFVPNPEPVTFAGVTYFPIALEVGQTSLDLQGGLAELELKIQNVTREMSALAESQDLRGTRVRIITVNAARLTDPSAILEDLDYEVNEYQITQEAAVVRLGHDQLLRQRTPYGLIMRDNCRWQYNFPLGRSPECGAGQGFVGPGIISGVGTSVLGSDTDFLIRFKPNVDAVGWLGVTRLVTAVSTNILMTIASPWSVAPSNSAGYTVHKPTCDKMLEGPNGCRSHNNVVRFGAFPGLPVSTGGV